MLIIIYFLREVVKNLWGVRIFREGLVFCRGYELVLRSARVVMGVYDFSEGRYVFIFLDVVVIFVFCRLRVM